VISISEDKIQLVADQVKKYESMVADDGNVHYVAGLLAAINLLGLSRSQGCECDPFPCTRVWEHAKEHD